MQTRTRAGLGFNAGVKDYRLTYYMDDYKVMETETEAAVRAGLSAKEAGAAIAAESSTGIVATTMAEQCTNACVVDLTSHIWHMPALVDEGASVHYARSGRSVS